MNRAVTYHKRINWRAYVAAAMALLYVLGQYGPEAAHALAHPHHSHAHEAEHTAEAERDPCHRRLYHADAAAGCEHPAHLTPLEQHCQWPDHTLPAAPLLSVSLPAVEAATPGLTRPVFRPSALMGEAVQHYFLRGPPAMC